MEIKDIIELMKAVSDNGLTKFELEDGDTKLLMKRENIGDSIVYTKADKTDTFGAENYVFAGNGLLETNKTADTENEHVIKCPLVGTFYASPSPESDNFVKVGDHVKKGQVVGIVEAMKLMNEIESEFDGVVEAILVENESAVEYGQPLIKIR